MKKCFSLLIFIVLFINSIYSKSLFKESFQFTSSYYDTKDCSLEISCKDDKTGIYFHDICFILKGAEFTIDYMYAKAGNGGQSGFAYIDTYLEIINESGEKEQAKAGEAFKKTYTAEQNKKYHITITKIENSNNSVSSEIVVSKDIIIVDEICTVGGYNFIPHFSGELFSISEKMESPWYLKINFNNALIREVDGSNTLYAKLNDSITIDYTPGKISYGGGGGDSSGVSWSSGGTKKTELRILNNKNEKQDLNENVLVLKEDITIKLYIITEENSVSSEELIFEVQIKIDEVNPKIYFNQEIKENEWIKTNGNLSVSAEDKETGIMRLMINGLVNKENRDGSELTIENDGVYTITAEDGVGNTTSATIKVDNKYPNIKITDKDGKEIRANIKDWYTNKEIKVKVEDDLSGIENVTSNDEKKEPEFDLENGNYKITAKDKAGNEKTINVKVDNKDPSITTDIIQFERNERGHITKITTKATAEEKGNNSGISSVIIQDGAGKMVASKIPDDSTEEVTVKAELFLDRSKLQEIKLKAVAEDVAMNIAEKSYEDIFIPPAIELECSDTYIHENKIITKLKLGNYSGNEIYYEGLKLKKIIYIDGEEVTEENFTRYFEESARENWREVTREQEISKEEIKHGVYDDILPAESGFGHKQTGYKIKWQLKNCIENEKGIWEESEVKTIVTSDTKGTIRIKIEGKGEEKEIDFTEGKFTEGNEGIKLAADGCVRVKILVDDADYEPYEIELRQQIAAGSNGEILSITRPGFIQKGTSGKAIYEGYDERYEKNKWVSFEQPEYLAYNRKTCLYLRVKEGYKGNESIIESGRIYLKAEPLDMGGFTLTVCEEADYNANGITATPYQCVELELSGDSETAEWSYGDGVTNTGRTVAHEWPQKDDRTGDTSEYELKINCKNNEIFIPVHIVDTKAGYLYGNEVWWGNHEILGSIKVKEGQKLKIGKLSGNEVMEILCIADEEEKYMGSLEVKGQLEIENGTGSVNMTAGINTVEGMEKETGIEGRKFLYWKGIEVYDGGEAVINGAEINGGQRGIAVASDGEATVNQSILKRNGIGVHVLGKFNAENIEVADNAEYGIKEEDGSSVKIKASVVQNNTVEWYDADDGVLTIEEIKEKIKE